MLIPVVYCILTTAPLLVRTLITYRLRVLKFHFKTFFPLNSRYRNSFPTFNFPTTILYLISQPMLVNYHSHNYPLFNLSNNRPVLEKMQIMQPPNMYFFCPCLICVLQANILLSKLLQDILDVCSSLRRGIKFLMHIKHLLFF